MLIARGKATKERHPGLGMIKKEPSAAACRKMLLDCFGRKDKGGKTRRKDGETGGWVSATLGFYREAVKYK